MKNEILPKILVTKILFFASIVIDTESALYKNVLKNK